MASSRPAQWCAAILWMCGEQGIAFLPFFATVGGGRPDAVATQDDAVTEIASAHGATPFKYTRTSTHV
ncbi:hypothetical protein Skr01_71890 [Sphaerisporangium krabiense]|uniref:Uncharacterized protein n=1 Tax=Sphaerisporangium krabiense TaxID=763782 RepID=A0A7W8Z8G1_9ACTN|nr:hypothetical protein [Sphaerisporangium krabiense]MBB5629329.1 hypothetical protein [Sphaerisporangium krabiense]GII67104.1 hypothetical protein Skr01_71890 [Sphaerisporangium krabiense]